MRNDIEVKSEDFIFVKDIMDFDVFGELKPIYIELDELEYVITEDDRNGEMKFYITLSRGNLAELREKEESYNRYKEYFIDQITDLKLNKPEKILKYRAAFDFNVLRESIYNKIDAIIHYLNEIDLSEDKLKVTKLRVLVTCEALLEDNALLPFDLNLIVNTLFLKSQSKIPVNLDDYISCLKYLKDELGVTIFNNSHIFSQNVVRNDIKYKDLDLAKQIGYDYEKFLLLVEIIKEYESIKKNEIQK